MEQFWAEFTHDNVISLPVVLARMLLATLLGSIIGLEREWRRRPAGLKTHMLVCLASATFTIVSLELVNVPVFNDQNIRMDPSRLVEAITSGVAFLAAGFIIFARGKITGITTGAGMWLAASVGLAIGAGFYLAAILCSIIVLITMSRLSSLECKYGLPVEKHIYIELDSTNAVNETIDGIASSGTTLHKPKVHPPYSGIEGHVGISAILPQALSDEQINEILQAILSLDHVEYTLRI